MKFTFLFFLIFNFNSLVSEFFDAEKQRRSSR